MNCDEVRELSPLWLSGELRGADRTGLASHLTECGRCAGALAEQAALDRRIAQAFRHENTSVAGIERAVRQRISGERRRRWVGLAGLAATLLLTVGIAQVARSTPPAALLADAARDHRLEVMENEPRHWRSEPEGIATLAVRFGLTGHQASRLAPDGYRLVRAKTCGLAGQPALHLVFSERNREVSLYIRRSAGWWQRGKARRFSAAAATENVASSGNARYLAVVVTGGGGTLAECRQMAQRSVALL